MSKKKDKPYFVQSAAVKHIYIDCYEILFDPIDIKEKSSIPSEHVAEYLKLLEQVQLQQGKYLNEVIKLKEKCPKSPEVDNLLGFVYAQTKQVQKANELIESGYTKYPEYFFAKINYADLLLRTKKINEVNKVFPFDEIKDNFNQRTKYHVSEYRSFMVLKSRYYMELKNKEKAYYYFGKALKADPANISVINLESKLKSAFRFYKLFSLIRKIRKNFNNSSTIS